MRKVLVTLLITTALVAPASAANCLVKNGSKTFLNWLPCEITKKDGVTTFEQGNFFTAEIRGGVLKSNINRFGGPKKDEYKLDSFGPVKETTEPDAACYSAKTLKICISLEE